MEKVATQRCRCCNGTGQEIDHQDAGITMRNLRLDRGFTLREVARRMALCAPYLCDLEYGRRHWTEALLKRYRDALLAHKHKS